MHGDGALAYAQWLHEAGRLDEAAASYRVILKRDRANPDALRGLAHVLAARGEYAAAVAQLARAGRAVRAPALQLELAQMNFLAGDPASAGRACEIYLQHRPGDPTALCLRAALREQRGDTAGAVDAYREALLSAPGNPAILNNCGLALRACGDYAAALDCYARALAAEPNYLAAWNNQGNALRELRREDEALTAFERALRIAPDDPSAHFNRGLLLAQLARHAEALTCFERAATLDPLHDDARIQSAESRLSLGEFAQATATLEALLDRTPDHAGALYLLATSRRYTAQDQPFIARLEQARKHHARDVQAQIALDFALGKVHDDLGDAGRAFTCFERANRAEWQRLKVPGREPVDDHADLRAEPASTWHAANASGDSGAGLVFIVGMPRSGTTLVEQILASHPAVYGAGETDYFNRALLRDGIADTARGTLRLLAERSEERLELLATDFIAELRSAAPDVERWIDKTPGHYAWLGVIQRLWPAARVVHCLRHPLDTCLSLYFQRFSSGHAYAYELRSLGRQYRAYHELMSHWRATLALRWMDVRYEDVVAEPREAARALLAHCELGWDEACAAPHRTQRTVTTASRWQVRQPVHGNARGRWKRYRTWIGPLIEELGVLAEY
ncbi:MAG: tetratricopeptide repeat protein [Gammaproteobacteria bacterium]|nr:tetratricopeptide repeat protein [Gammaproteobacteria bacterium]